MRSASAITDALNSVSASFEQVIAEIRSSPAYLTWVNVVVVVLCVLIGVEVFRRLTGSLRIALLIACLAFVTNGAIGFAIPGWLATEVSTLLDWVCGIINGIVKSIPTG